MNKVKKIIIIALIIIVVMAVAVFAIGALELQKLCHRLCLAFRALVRTIHERLGKDETTFVLALGDQTRRVIRFETETELSACDFIERRYHAHGLSDHGGRAVRDADGCADRCRASRQHGSHAVLRGVFKKCDERRRRKHWQVAAAQCERGVLLCHGIQFFGSRAGLQSFHHVEQTSLCARSGVERRQDLRFEKRARRVRRNGVQRVVHEYGNAVAAVANAECTLQRDTVLEPELRNERADLLDDFARAFQMAGTADANGNRHGNLLVIRSM